MGNPAWRRKVRTEVEAQRGENPNFQRGNAETRIDPQDGPETRVRFDEGVASNVIDSPRDCVRRSLLAFTGRGAIVEANMEPGTVVILEPDGSLQPSHCEYDGRVIGVVVEVDESEQVLVLGRRRTQLTRIPIAILGEVYCKVDAQFSPIEVGDLLTTSATSGHAMKAADLGRARKAKIGKALSSVPQGRSLIPVSLALE